MKKILLLTLLFFAFSEAKTYKVIDTRSDDALNVRADAGVSNKKIGELAYNARGIEIITCKKSSANGKLWCKIKHPSTKSGWVSTRFLALDKKAKQKPKINYDYELKNALKNGNIQKVKEYIKKGADVNKSYVDTYTRKIPLQLAVNSYSKNSYEITEILLDNDANPNQITDYGETVMFDAVSKDTLKVSLLRRYGADIDTINKWGNTLLHKANNDNTKYLLKNGLKKYINKKNDKGNTPLFTTNRFKFETLLKNGANIYTINNEKFTPVNNLLDQLRIDNIGLNIRKYRMYTEFIEKLEKQYNFNIKNRYKNGMTLLDMHINKYNLTKKDVTPIVFLLDKKVNYKKVYSSKIDNYFRAARSGDKFRMKSVLAPDSFAYIQTELNTKCAGDIKCQRTLIKNEYAVSEYMILKEESKKYSILVTNNKKQKNIIKLREGKDGISFVSEGGGK